MTYRYCTKCRTYASAEGGRGQGRQYRCATCWVGRALAMLARREQRSQHAN